jgi:membrane protease subunit HflK
MTVGWTDAEIKDETGTAMTPGQMLTGDHNLVNVQAVIEYRVIFDQVDKYVLMEESVEPLIARAAEAALAEWLAGHEVDEAILRGKRQLEPFLRETIEKWIAPYSLGVQIDRASILLIDPPSEVRESFNEVGQAHTRKETQMKEAETQASRKQKKADEDKYRIERETEAYTQEQNFAATADADNFLIRLKEYRLLSKQNPRLLYNLWLDEVTRIYAQMRRSGRIDVLDNYIGGDGLNITQFPLQKK